MATVSELLTKAIEHHRGGRLQAAEQLYRQILASEPDHADAIHLLGVIAAQFGNHKLALEYYTRAIQLGAKSEVLYLNLATAYETLRMSSEAIDCYRRALDLNPNNVHTHVNLGAAFRVQGQLDEAAASNQRALELNPNCIEAHNNLGIVFDDKGRFDDAVVSYRRALELAPANVQVHNNMGNSLKKQGKLDEAAASYRRAVEIQPDDADAYNNLGNVLKDQGKLDEAINCFRRSLELNPDNPVTHSNLVYTQLFCSTENSSPMDEAQRWNERFAVPWLKFIRPHDNDRSPDRRLKIGYVSPDFYDHCQSFFTMPLLTSHDHANFEIVCYSDVIRPDQITERLRSAVDLWRNIAGLDHDQVAQLIRDDGIDILVDLTMHMAGNRLLVFARKPAPIQVSWLAYPGSTGLSTIDYRLTDHYLEPLKGNGRSSSEEIPVRLPETFWCYDPLADKPAVNSLPAVENGYVTFGCLNNFCKVNPTILKIWAQVLNAVDHSRLILLSARGDHQESTLKFLENEGVSQDCVSFVTPQPRSKYLAYYHNIDIGLDTIPYNGHTTSLDSFWMGVPIVTLVGSTVVGRAGICQLMNLDLRELIAETPGDYVRIAADLARNVPRISELRATLRERLRASPLMDAPRFTRHIEAVYRQMWKHWCRESIDKVDVERRK